MTEHNCDLCGGLMPREPVDTSWGASFSGPDTAAGEALTEFLLRELQKLLDRLAAENQGVEKKVLAAAIGAAASYIVVANVVQNGLTIEGAILTIEQMYKLETEQSEI